MNRCPADATRALFRMVFMSEISECVLECFPILIISKHSLLEFLLVLFLDLKSASIFVPENDFLDLA